MLAARERPPVVQPPKPVTLRLPSIKTLPNGLRVVVIERHTLPLVTLRLVVKAGSEADPADRPGTAQLVANLLNQGTGRRSAWDVAEAVDGAGGTLDTGAEWDSSFAALSVLGDHAELAFDLLADMVIHPAFAQAEVERKRKQTLAALEVARDDPAYIADTTFRSVLFSGTSYGHPEDGTRDAVARLRAQDLRNFHSRYYLPSNSVLAVVGDVTAEAGLDQARKYFGGWEDRPVSPSPTASCPGPASREVVVIDKPDAVQTEIRIGSLGVSRDSPEFYALSAANQILGGPAENRLFKSLRSREGLTYGASSELICHQHLGSWVAKTFTRTPETVKTVQMALDQIKRLHNHSITQDELDRAKGYLIGHLALEFETSEGIATQFLDLLLHNLPLDYWNRFPERIDALTPEDVWAAARQYLHPDRSVVVLVGDAAGFKKDVRKLGPTRVIPLESLDFASASLEHAQSAAGKH